MYMCIYTNVLLTALRLDGELGRQRCDAPVYVRTVMRLCVYVFA